MFNTAELTLVLPGIAAVLKQKINSQTLPTYLTKILKHAHFKTNNTPLDRLLLNCFSYLDHSQDIPLASLMSTHKHSLIASLCYLHPDRDQLLMFADQLTISEDESRALLNEVQPLLTHIPATAKLHTAETWLIELDTSPDLALTALSQVNGKHIEPYLPTGIDRKPWLKLWTEIQMQLFSAKINQQRESHGKLPINSVWFWGSGNFKAKENNWQSVRGSQPILQLITDHLAIAIKPKPDALPEKLARGEHLIVLDPINTEQDWQQQLTTLDHTYFQTLWQHCKRRQISTLQLIIPNHGCYTVKTHDCWKFWKS